MGAPFFLRLIHAYAVLLLHNPFDFVGRKRQGLRLAVYIIENCRLLFTRIVGYGVSISVEMCFRQRVGAIGFFIHIFLARRPQNSAVQKLSVLRRVRNTRDIKTSTLAVYVGRHLHFDNVDLSYKSIREYDIHHVRAVKRVNIFLVFAVIHRTFNAV